MRTNIILIFVTVLMVACSAKKSEEIISKSADGNAQITISGTKNSFADPWQTTIKISGYNNNSEAQTEIFAGALDKDVITFQWENNNICKIVIKQQDNTIRTFITEIQPDKLELHEELK